MAEQSRGSLPSKLYFRIGEVAELVGVEPHVLRYWEREFRTIRPTKSAKGQRVYSRRDVENLMRVRELLYREGFTIAGAKKKLGRGDEDAEATAASGAAKARGELVAMRAEVESFLEELGPVAPYDRAKK
jgi:DNA-binding transcriptional MerR regulator